MEFKLASDNQSRKAKRAHFTAKVRYRIALYYLPKRTSMINPSHGWMKIKLCKLMRDCKPKAIVGIGL